MFACLLIVCELAILYTVFWYIFLREEKPYKVHGNLWGRYDYINAHSENRFDPILPDEKYGWISSNEETEDVGFSAHHEWVKFKHGSARRQFDLPRMRRNPAIRYGWVLEDEDGPRVMS